MTTPARDAALEEIARLNALLSELLDPPGKVDQAQIWARIRVQLDRASRPTDAMRTFPRETAR